MTIYITKIYKTSFILVLFLASWIHTNGQDFGLSFSYFIPTNGEFSTPISPFSFRGVGVDFNRFLGIETGGTLYRMSGMSLKDLDLPTDKSLLGTSFMLMVPLDLVIKLQGQRVTLNLKGGVFGFAGFAQKINHGNFDRAFISRYGYNLANSELTLKNKPGWGYQAGAEFVIQVTNQFAVTLEGKYINGSASMPITGTLLASLPGEFPVNQTVSYPDAKLDFRGLEFSIGVLMTSGGGRPQQRNKRR